MSVSVDIEKRLGDFHLRVAFEAEDCVHGLLGASGCGKSMTLRCIAGVVTPDRGRITVNDCVLFDSEQRIDLPPQQRRVGLLFQNYALFPNMTVEGNLLAALRGREKTAARAAVRDMVGRFHLQGLEHHRPAQLSGGQQQRVALARILLTQPEILMLDEPLSALDSDLRWQTELELQELLEDFSGTTLLVTHSREEVYRLCRSVTVLDRGRGAGAEEVRALFETSKTLSACLLSGCKNYSRAAYLDAQHVRVPDWGVTLRCSAPQDVRYLAVRAHHIRIADAPGENVLTCRVQRVIDDVFSAVVMAETPGGDAAQSRLRVELPKENASHLQRGDTVLLQLPAEALMPLTAAD